MLNKELLLAPTKEELAYTHIVTVVEIPFPATMSYYGYVLNKGGAISPEYILNSDIQIQLQELYSIYEEVVTHISTDGTLLPDPTSIWLGRPDKRICMQANQGSDTGGYANWRALNIFTTEDLGKEIPIWLSYERPPWYDEHSGGTGN